MRIKATAGRPERGERLCWQVEGMVRGERLGGTLFAPEKDEVAQALVVWVHAHTDPEIEPPISSSPSALLELHWPLVGPRHDAKLSPLLTQCLTETTPSATRDAFWERFSDQAATEVATSLTAVRGQQQLQIGPSTELRLDLALPGTPPARAHWGPTSGASEDWCQRVLGFLKTLRPVGPA